VEVLNSTATKPTATKHLPVKEITKPMATTERREQSEHPQKCDSKFLWRNIVCLEQKITEKQESIKGKLVDIICPNYNLCVRFNGGANAGHTVVADGVEYKFHLLPSGMLHPGTTNVIGNGCVVDIEGMFEEMEPLRENNVQFDDRYFVSERAQMVTLGLRMADAKFEE